METTTTKGKPKRANPISMVRTKNSKGNYGCSVSSSPSLKDFEPPGSKVSELENLNRLLLQKNYPLDLKNQSIVFPFTKLDTFVNYHIFSSLASNILLEQISSSSVNLFLFSFLAP